MTTAATTTAPPGRRRPTFSVVAAVYNVDRYLPEFTQSVENLRLDDDALEVIAVDDGSTDGSLATLRAWADRSRFRIHVLTKPNGGQASARNLGLESVRGDWVAFSDPDDAYDPGFFAAAEAFAEAHPEVEVMTARVMIADEIRNHRGFTHPRDWQYRRGNRLAYLDVEPSVYPASTPGSMFRFDRIRRLGLRMDEQLRPSFEDSHFLSRYLLDMERPAIGILRDAIYVYRRRGDGSSTQQGSLGHPGRYGQVLERGYLGLLEEARGADGTIPAWVQNVIVYELSWYISGDEGMSTNSMVREEDRPRFERLLEEVLARLDPEVVEAHRGRDLRPLWRFILAHARRGTDWYTHYVTRSRADRVMGLRRYHYRFAGRPPSERFLVDGEPIEPPFAKTMAHRYLGLDLMWERVVWLPRVPGLEIELAGERVPVLRTWVARQPRQRPAGSRRAAPPPRRRGLVRRASDLLRRVRRRWRQPSAFVIRSIAGSPLYRRFRGAWVLMDRIHEADDNGERLFEHIRAKRLDINAWFVLERGTPDWNRLAARGERRLVAHGSWTWTMLMLNCAWLLGSHVDQAIVQPPALQRIRRVQRWRVGFLQHGIIKDDLARWLNSKELDLFVVSTEAERASIAADGTAYRFCDRETRNTGLPRFDRQLQLGRAVAPADRDLVILAPTWRQWLMAPLEPGSQRRRVVDGFWESDYATNWLGLLRSPQLEAAVRRRGWRLGFMPHPNLQGLLEDVELPAHVERLAFAGTDVQALYARAALLVTDYSSVAFNMAYLDRPVVYFQFDRERMLGGGHVGRKGYFEYERDGFGPVVEDLAAALQATLASIEHGPSPAPEYQARIDLTFPVRDGRACERVVAAVEELSRPFRLELPGVEPGSART